MSQHHTETVSCPECGRESEFTVWDSVNTALDPEMKARVRTGELFLWTCPGCGAKRWIEYATLYHQMEDHVMIWYTPNDPSEAIRHFETVKRGGDPAVTADADYRFRVVTSRYQLREKLMALDEGLDDRVIELMKPFELLTLQAENVKIDELFFDKAPDGERVFALRLADGRWARVPFEQGLYDHVAESWADELAKDDSVRIDFSWAWTLMEENLSLHERKLGLEDCLVLGGCDDDLFLYSARTGRYDAVDALTLIPIDDEGFDTFEELFFYAYHSVGGDDCFIENDAED